MFKMKKKTALASMLVYEENEIDEMAVIPEFIVEHLILSAVATISLSVIWKSLSSCLDILEMVV